MNGCTTVAHINSLFSTFSLVWPLTWDVNGSSLTDLGCVLGSLLHSLLPLRLQPQSSSRILLDKEVSPMVCPLGESIVEDVLVLYRLLGLRN
jgi:hypothetical protein